MSPSRRACLVLAASVLSFSSALLAAPIRVTGRVQSEKAGLSGARLELFSAYEGYAEAVRRLTEKTAPVPLAKTRTDAEGDFEILVPESGCYRLEVRAEGYLAEEISILPLVEDIELPPTTLMQGSPVEVRTVGPDGRPLAGIEVRAIDSPFSRRLGEGNFWTWIPLPPRATTDREGRASISWFKLYGPPVVAATSPRFLGQQTIGRPGEAITLRLIPGRSGWIEARDAAGKPVPGALARWNGWPVGITGPDGRLEVAGPQGDSELTLETREGLGARLVQTEVKGILPVRLEPPRRISGRVVDSPSRKPVAGAVVWSGFPLEAPVVRSGADGAFLLEVPAAQESWLNTGAAGFLPGERQLAKKGAAGPVVLALSPSALISGVVVDRGGQPVAGAGIRLGYTRGRQGFSAEVRSGAGGSFRLNQLPPGGTFELTATHPRFARTTATARTGPAGQPSPPARIVMEDGQTAFGRVVDEGGRPVSGAELTLSRSREELQAVSDEEGRFEILHLTPGRFSLLADHPGHAQTWLEGIEIRSGTPRLDLGTIKLLPAEVIEGRVTDTRGGPIAGAEVQVSEERSGMSFPLRSWAREILKNKDPLRTGPDGSFRAERLEGGKRYNLLVQHEGYVQASVPGVEAPTAEPLRIEMKVARNLSGQVVGPEGEPVAGASLTWTQEVRTNGGSHSRIAPLGITDSDGRFRVSGPPPGPITLDVTADGYVPRRIDGFQVPEDKDLEDVKITLQHGSDLDVRVLSAEGEPVPGAWVEAAPEKPGSEKDFMFLDRPDRNRTDSAGRCRLTVPGPGTYKVSAMGSGSSAITRVTAGPGVTPVELRFPPGAEVSGRVIGEDGSGIAGAQVQLEAESGNRRGTSTAPDGTFLLSTVPDGSYRLKATWKELASGSLDLAVNGSPVRGLELRLDRKAEPKGTLTGHVLGLTPEELPLVRVTVTQERGGYRSTFTNREGSYRIEDLEPGEWTVQAIAPQGRQAEGTVQIPAGGEAALDLEIRKGFTLTGRVLVDGSPLSGGQVQASWGKENRAYTSIAYDGTFTLRGLTAGPATLIITSTQGFAGTRDVRVTEDQAITVALSTGRLGGRVTSATGEPIEDAAVSVDAWIPALEITVSAPGTRTGADGTFELLQLGAGTYKVKVSKEGFAPAEVTAEVPAGGGSAPIAVVLKPQEGTP